MTAGTYYTKAFCVRCLKDCPCLGGKWRNRMFFCASCAQQVAAKGVQTTGGPR